MRRWMPLSAPGGSIFSARAAAGPLNFIAYYLKMLLVDIHLIYTSSETKFLRRCCISISGTPSSGSASPIFNKAVKALHFAHSRGAQVIAITDSPASPIADLATHLLLAHSDMATVVDSLVAPLSVINALIVAASLRKMDSVTQTLTELEELGTNTTFTRNTARIDRYRGGRSMRIIVIGGGAVNPYGGGGLPPGQAVRSK